MNTAQKILGNLRAKAAELKKKGLARIEETKVARQEYKTAYKEAYNKERIKVAKKEAAKDAEAGGRFKRKLGEMKKKGNTPKFSIGRGADAFQLGRRE
jgi:deoxyhypusine synthase